MTGDEVKMTIKNSRLRQWEIAQEMGISEAALSKALRGDIEESAEKKIMEAIQSVKKKIRGSNIEKYGV